MRTSGSLSMLVAVVGAIGALLLAAERRADACSPGPGIAEAQVLPTDGLAGVPTNTRIVAVWDGFYADSLCDEQVRVWLRPKNGVVVALAAERRDEPYRTVVVATPEAPLDAATSYEILVMPIPTGPTFCEAGTPAVVATFTTGDSADTTAPVFGGLESATPSPDICAFDCTCDFDWGRLLATLGWSPATDETPAEAMRYDIYRTDTVEPLLTLVRWATLSKLCWGTDIEGLGAGMIETGDGSFFVRAVDLAGNEDDNTETVDVVFDCSSVIDDTPDAGPTDGGAGADAGPSDGDDSGCGCQLRDSEDTASLVWFGLALLALRRRTRRRN